MPRAVDLETIQQPTVASEPSQLSPVDQEVEKTKAVWSGALPNLSWEILQLGLKREQAYCIEIQEHTNQAEKLKTTLQQLIELNGKLKLSDKTTVVTTEIDTLVKEIDTASIHLFNQDEKKLSTERVSEIKAQINSHIDRIKTEMQTIFSTRIQISINEMNSLLDTIRSIIKYSDRLNSTIISNQRK